ncbi:MAG: hypothetical protein M1834_000528 [Cirrosporium novae-zelandiae]|nr:MAG: hypothetical protein M1834_000528 [Cirrosporium novae-zelandiae]
MNPVNALESQELAKGHEPKLATPVLEKELELKANDHPSITEVDPDKPSPTEEELQTLHRVPGKVPWQAYSVGFVEFCERFSYYGCTAVYVNFIQQPLPDGSSTGAGFSGQSGALGMGQRASTGLTTFNSFWSYTMPLAGAYVADQYWGRFKTIQCGIGLALLGHLILVISAIPPVLKNPHGGLAAFTIGLVIMGLGTGAFKPNVSVLISEQYRETRMYVTTDKKGQRVIVDPSLTISRIYLWFYLMINIGSLIGQITMVYAEKYVGFYLAFLLPTLMFTMAPIVLFICRHKYILAPPTGSVLGKALHLWAFAAKGRWSWNPATTRKNMLADDFWEKAKPSNVAIKPKWMTFDDAWVDEVRRGLMACRVFLWYPLYWLCYVQINNNITSQAATMELHGAPNDLIQNLDPLAIIILIPILDIWVYPAMRKAGIRFTPLKKIACGFFVAACGMVSAAVIQYYIYHTGACGHYMNSCDTVAPINVWVQTVPYVLVAMSEILASVTSLEYAFTKAPKNMRSTVQAVALFMNAISSAIAQAFVSLSDDPLLIWNYSVIAILAFIGGCGFWLNNYKLDREEDKLNMLPAASYSGKTRDETRVEEEGAEIVGSSVEGEINEKK